MGHVGDTEDRAELRAPDGLASGSPAPRAAIAPDPEPGEQIGPYELLEVLGRGGAGTVFRARRHPDGAILALKVLAAAKVRRARIVQRFFDEVRAASSVRHRGLVEVFDFIEREAPRRLAYAMEYVPGEVLRVRLRREGILDLRLAIQIGIQICDALAALHDAGIIHRDLKPENILVGTAPEGRSPTVKLFDFGVVKFLPVDRTADLEGQRQGGTFVGTPRYMAPEQAAGSAVDHRADLFALGVLLFEMITGRCPHEGDSLRDVVMAKLKGAPRIRVNPEQEILPHELTDIVDRCLQLRPSSRPRDALEVRSALHDAELVLFTVGSMRAGPDGSAVRVRIDRDPAPPVSAPPPAAFPADPSALAPRGPTAPEPARARPRPRRGRWLPRLAVVGLLVLAAGLAVAVRRWVDDREGTVRVPAQVGRETPGPAQARD